MDGSYQKVFELHLSHLHYWEQAIQWNPQNSELSVTEVQDSSAALSLVPTVSCRSLLCRLRWLFRPRPYGGDVYALAQTTAEGIAPQISPGAAEGLSFWIAIKDPSFANFTNLTLERKRHQIYYFSNLSGNHDGELFLTQPLLAYEENREYHLGQLVTHAGQTLEAILYQRESEALPNLVTDWKVVPNSQYVTGADLMPQRDPSFTYTVPQAKPDELLAFSLLDSGGKTAATVRCEVPASHREDSPIQVSLNFSDQSPGRYGLVLNGEPVEEFVLADCQESSQQFGLVEISLDHRRLAPAFSPIDLRGGKAHIEPKRYTICFKNRLTRWRYHSPGKHGFCQSDEQPEEDDCMAIEDEFVVIDEYQYMFRSPVGLRHRKVGRPLNNGKADLPFPRAAAITPTVEPASGDRPRHVSAVYSDIYL